VKLRIAGETWTCDFLLCRTGHRDHQCFGGITLSLPESASFEIVADCHSGDIDSEFQSDSLKLISGSGQAIRTSKENMEAGAGQNYFEDELWVNFAAPDQFGYSRAAEATARKAPPPPEKSEEN